MNVLKLLWISCETTGTGNVEHAELRCGENAIVQAFAKAVRFWAAVPMFIQLVDNQQVTDFLGDAKKASPDTLSPSAFWHQC